MVEDKNGLSVGVAINGMLGAEGLQGSVTRAMRPSGLMFTSKVTRFFLFLFG